MLYLVHGDDEFRRAQWLGEFKQKVSLDPDMASLNTATLDGRTLTLDELVANCAAAPFLADKRLVIVEGLASRIEPKQGQKGGEKGDSAKRAQRQQAEKAMADYLASVPPTTDLVLLENRAIGANNPFHQAVKAGGGKVIEMRLPKPGSPELREWVEGRVQAHGAKIGADALDQLLAFTGNNLRLLDQEVAKLAAYGDGRPVTREDVRNLVAYSREEVVFDAMDALGRRDTRQALRRLHSMLEEGQAAQYLLTMIARQVRLLIQTREALDNGVSAYELPSVLGMAPFVAQKMTDQARNFSLPTLVAFYDQLVEMDQAIKNGRLEAEAAVDLFVMSVTRR